MRKRIIFSLDEQSEAALAILTQGSTDDRSMAEVIRNCVVFTASVVKNMREGLSEIALRDPLRAVQERIIVFPFLDVIARLNSSKAENRSD